MDFHIDRVSQRDGQLVLHVSHFRGDRIWFREAYTFQGREGLRHKIATDSNDDPLTTDDQPVLPGGDGNHTLPDGKEWKREAIPHLRLGDVLSVIRSIHAQRLAANWPDDPREPILGRFVESQKDRDGIGALRTVFDGVAGTEFEA